MEEVAAHDDSCVVGVLLLQVIIYTNLLVHDIAFAVVWNVLATDENGTVSVPLLTPGMP